MNSKNGDESLNLVIYSDPDYDLFAKLIRNIKSINGFTAINEFQGLDQIYYDFYLEKHKFTLHLDNFMGISIYRSVEATESKTEKIEYLFFKIAAILQGIVNEHKNMSKIK